jgi:hypothetical protein
MSCIIHLESRELLASNLTPMAKDRFHNVVRTALEKDGWIITSDPYEINVDDVDFEIDLAAEQLLAAELEGQKIAVEVKSFISPSNVSEFHTALGQFLNYRDALEKIEPERQLFLAVRVPIYETFFQRKFIASAVERYQLRLVIYDVQQELIHQWL